MDRFDVEKVREAFPILHRQTAGGPLIYLDNAATMQMPRCVMEAMTEQVYCRHANVHRGLYELSELATGQMEAARGEIAAFLHAAAPEEIVFTSGTTAGINLLAQAMEHSSDVVFEDREVIVSALEHNSNYLPWRELCRRTGAKLRILPADGAGELSLAALGDMLSARTAVVAMTGVSNVTGTVNPVRAIVEMVHRAGALAVLDFAQAMRGAAVDVQAMDCDFLCFSAHKLCGPTSTGILYGKLDLLRRLPPATYGGGMVQYAEDGELTYEEPPLRFESGTPNITGIAGLVAAVRYLKILGIDAIAGQEATLLAYAEAGLQRIPRLHVIGAPAKRAGAISFRMEGLHPSDVAKLLDKLGIAVRAGQQCAALLMEAYGVDGVVRISPAFYNTTGELDMLFQGLERVAALAGRMA